MNKTLYIGAKCVPSFYIGSGGSSDWASGVPYEPLTVVTYNGSWYISKIAVPASTTAPAAGTYWAKVPGYLTELDASFIEWAQEHIGDLEEDVTQLQGDVTGLRDDNSELKSTYAHDLLSYRLVENTYINSSNGALVPYYDATYPWSSTSKIDVGDKVPLVITADRDGADNAFYDSEGVFIPTALTLAVGDNFIVPPNNAAFMAISNRTENMSRLVVRKANFSDSLKILTDNSLWIMKNQLTPGILQSVSFVVAADDSCVTYFYKIPIESAETIKIIVPEIEGINPHIRWAWYDSDGNYLGQDADVTNNKKTFPANARYFAFALLTYDTSGNKLTDYDLYAHFPVDNVIQVLYGGIDSNFARTNDVLAWGYNEFVRKKNEKIQAGYSLGSDFIKHPVVATEIGHLLFSQAFCEFDGKYYSIEEGKLGIQNSSFETLETIETLSFGHGNNLQLGNSNFAYISGSLDHKIYKLNLSTKAIDEIIQLPLSGGFETCAVDELNNIAYVLYTTETALFLPQKYEFIIYNITSAQIVSRKWLPFKITALQSIDLVYGRIVCVSGDNTNTNNRIFVLDMNGNEIASIKLTMLPNDEPEGIFVDRNDGALKLSTYNKKLYTIEDNLT